MGLTGPGARRRPGLGPRLRLGLGLGLAAVLAAIVVSACVMTGCRGDAAGAATPPPAGTSATVDIRNVAFNPATVTVRAGQTVAWRFDDGTIAHNVTGDGWSSPDRTSGFYTHTFAGAGTYRYRCTIHSGMTGQVVVTP